MHLKEKNIMRKTYLALLVLTSGLLSGNQVVYASDAKVGVGYSYPFRNGSILSFESGFKAALFINPPYTFAPIESAVRNAYSATARHVPRVMRSVRYATSSGAATSPSRHCLAPYASSTAIRESRFRSAN